jgi:hypothetical protein
MGQFPTITPSMHEHRHGAQGPFLKVLTWRQNLLASYEWSLSSSYFLLTLGSSARCRSSKETDVAGSGKI